MTQPVSQASAPDEGLLLRELTHRINNEFASAISTVCLTAARSSNNEVKVALNAVAKRLHYHAEVHRSLRMPEHDAHVDAAAFVYKLCQAINRSKLADTKIRLVFVTSPLWLASNRCWRLGMIVYELVTNAARHAFADANGEIRVELRHAGAFAECRVLDNGSASKGLRPGHGLKIVRELVKALDGRFEQQLGSGGSRSSLIFPCGDAARVERNSTMNATGHVSDRSPL